MKKKSNPVIFRTNSVIFRTYPVVFRTNAVILRTTWGRNLDSDLQKLTETNRTNRNRPKWTERQKDTKKNIN